MKHLYRAVALLLLTLCTHTLRAQWIPSTALEGGPLITDIIEFKSSVYMYVHEVGVYRSTDNGASWALVHVEPQDEFGYFVVIHDELLVLTGKNTTRSSDGLTFNSQAGIGDFVNNVATDGTTLVAATNRGVYVSSNGGSSWSRAADPRTQHDIRAVTVRGDVILATCYERRGIVFKSADGGVSWVEINTGAQFIFELAYQGSTAFMHVKQGGVYRSINDGQTWQEVRSGVGWGIAVTPTHIYHVGTDKYEFSSNQGDTWTEVPEGPPSYVGIQAIFVGSSYIFAGTDGAGPYRKPIDNSASWTVGTTGYNAVTVLDIDVKDETILAGTDFSFVRKSTDEAQTWSPRVDQTLKNGHKFARMDTDLFVATSSFFRSEDEGLTWQEKKINSASGFTGSVAVFKNKIYASQNFDVYVSSNRGDSWLIKSGGLTGVIKTLYADNEHVYAGTSDGLFRLHDNGERWEKIDMGITPQTVAQVAKLGSILLVQDLYFGLMKSEDDGKSWTGIKAGIVSMAVRNNDIYAGDHIGQLYHSVDSGATWNNITANMPSALINTINFTSKHVLVGTRLKGLWLRPIGEVNPPYFNISLPASDSTFIKDRPIVFRIDQPIQMPDGAEINESNLTDLFDVTTLSGAPANFTATLTDDPLTITIHIIDAEENTTYKVTVVPVANEQGLESKSRSFVLRAIGDVPPVVTDISIETMQYIFLNLWKELFIEKYTDPNLSPLASIRVNTLPTHGTLRMGSATVAVNAEIPVEQLSKLSYGPDEDFAGTDRWSYSASDGTSYSNIAFFNITVLPVTGISEWSGQLSVFPNPVDGSAIIEMVNGMATDRLLVMDLSGRIIPVPTMIEDKLATVDFTEVPAGMYVVRIGSGNQAYYGKVVRR